MEESIDVHAKSQVVEGVCLVEDEFHFVVVEECAGNWRIRYALPTADTTVPPGIDEEHVVPIVVIALQSNQRRRRRRQTLRDKAGLAWAARTRPPGSLGGWSKGLFVVCGRSHRFGASRLEWMASVLPVAVPKKVTRLDIETNIPDVDRGGERMGQARLTLRLRSNCEGIFVGSPHTTLVAAVLIHIFGSDHDQLPTSVRI